MTTLGMVEEQASRNSDAVAIAAPGRLPLSYGRLADFLGKIGLQLRVMSVARNDRVAIVLPNGPETAVAFLAVSGCATAAPLNPGYRAQEFDFYLSDLNARAVLVQEGTDSAVLEVARARGIPIIPLVPDAEAEAGIFTLRGPAVADNATVEFAEPDDCALILHTSGTTARPKIVPLTHRNLCISAETIRESLSLTPADRCLNVMPLFHVHGLIGALLASLSAGASVACTPGLLAPRFFSWVEELSPTWYTAVPSMHQTVLARAAGNRSVIENRPLRFVRSCSAALAPQLMKELEETFHVPVIEAYGMTEAAHQMASNPLPPAARKPGSVGLATGLEVAVMTEDGRLLPPEQTGEVVIRGPNVMNGYENNPAANQSAFAYGWFHTGDLGRLDAQGYLFLSGRLKEIINRGGEKISPREVDEVLLEHPAVAQAVAFGVPDAQLGQEVAAAVVLRKGTDNAPSEAALREFLSARLADFKVPKRIVFLDEIPKGPTGKIQRIGLAETLGLTQLPPPAPPKRIEFVAPRNALERHLATIWMTHLGVDQVGVHDTFLDLGGDSILAAQVLSRLRQTLLGDLSLVSFFDHPTIASQAELIMARLEQLSDQQAAVLLARLDEKVQV